VRHWVRQWWRTVAIVSVAVAAAVLTIISPILLDSMARRPMDWSRLSDAGQAYGAASALLSGFALCGITVSLIFQRRQALVTLQHSVRQRQFELAGMAMADPVLLYAIEPYTVNRGHERLQIFANQWVHHWRMCWDLGDMDDAAVRMSIGTLFEGEVGRRWWEENRDSFQSQRGRLRRFASLVEDEHRKALASGIPPVPLPGPAPAAAGRPDPRVVWSVALGSAGVLGAAVAYRRWRRSTPRAD
jgi:hypothetical protein